MASPNAALTLSSAKEEAVFTFGVDASFCGYLCRKHAKIRGKEGG